MTFPESISKEFVGLMEKIFKFSPDDRLTARELIEEHFFHQMDKMMGKKNGFDDSNQDHLKTSAESQNEEQSN